VRPRCRARRWPPSRDRSRPVHPLLVCNLRQRRTGFVNRTAGRTSPADLHFFLRFCLTAAAKSATLPPIDGRIGGRDVLSTHFPPAMLVVPSILSTIHGQRFQEVSSSLAP